MPTARGRTARGGSKQAAGSRQQAVGSLGGGAQPVDRGAGTVFEFDSGGAVHFSPYGVWAIELNAAGGLAITHNVFGQITDYGRVTLAEAEAESLWTAVR